jgi:hypothetical protein
MCVFHFVLRLKAIVSVNIKKLIFVNGDVCVFYQVPEELLPLKRYFKIKPHLSKHFTVQQIRTTHEKFLSLRF